MSLEWGPFLLLTAAFVIVVVVSLQREYKRKARLMRVAQSLGGEAKGDKIIGKLDAMPYEIRYQYTGKGRRLTSVVLCTPFEGYPFRFRKVGPQDLTASPFRKIDLKDPILKVVFQFFEDFEVGQKDFDEQYHVAVSNPHIEWMKSYTAASGRLESVQWLLTAGYSSVYSNGGRLFAVYPAVFRGFFPVSNLEKESALIWDPDYLKKSLERLETLGRNYEVVPYESWEEWLKRMIKEGPRFEGAQMMIIAILAAALSWMAILVWTAARSAPPV